MSAVVLFVGLLVFLAHLFSALFEKTRVPDVLPLVFLGVLIGPVFGFATPESFGQAGSVLTLISLTVILFEGGLGLDFAGLKESTPGALRLTGVNFVASVVAAGGIAAATGRFTPVECVLLGAILGGTSSAVVIPMAARLPLAEKSRTTLLLESTFSDVLCIVVTLGLLQMVRLDELRLGLMAGQIIASFTLAGVIGAAGALFWSHVLERVRKLENSLFTTPAFVFVIYGVAELLGYSGAIAALAFGVTLGNIGALQAGVPALKDAVALRPMRLNDAERAFFGEIVFLLKTFFFVYIGLSIRFNDWALTAFGLGLVAALFVSRVPVVRLALGAGPSRFDASIAFALIPKGLAAAVLASLPAQAGLAGGAAIQDVVYAVILFSIVATSALTFLIEKGRAPAAFARLFPENAP